MMSCPLPEPVEASRPETPALAAEEAPRPYKVLIIEDEPELAEILEVNLEHRGFTTLLAENGLTACRLVSAERPELILLDILLPDLDGWEICRMIRSHPETAIARTPIIMVSALGRPEDRLRGFDLGADAYLPKPYSLKELVPKARELAARQRASIEQERELAELRSLLQQHDEWQRLLFHELRNQMCIISGFAKQLTSPAIQDDQEKSQFCLRAIDRSSSYLSNLAEELKLIQQIEWGHDRLPTETLSPRVLLEEVLQILEQSGQCPPERIRPDLAETPPCSLNNIAFKLILGNLIDNALKYSGSESPVDIRLEPLADGFRLSIRDHGPGIAPTDLPHIFDKFFRGAGIQNKALGTGLGLYTAQTLSIALGGELRVESRLGAGAEFTLQLASSGEAATLAVSPETGNN